MRTCTRRPQQNSTGWNRTRGVCQQCRQPKSRPAMSTQTQKTQRTWQSRRVRTGQVGSEGYLLHNRPLDTWISRICQSPVSCLHQRTAHSILQTRWAFRWCCFSAAEESRKSQCWRRLLLEVVEVLMRGWLQEGQWVHGNRVLYWVHLQEVLFWLEKSMACLLWVFSFLFYRSERDKIIPWNSKPSLSIVAGWHVSLVCWKGLVHRNPPVSKQHLPCPQGHCICWTLCRHKRDERV